MPDTVPLRTQTLDDFARLLASDAPVPGGGSACAISAGLAASLAAMVARLSTGRERYAAHQSLHQAVIAAADRLRDGFLDLAQEDADAYDAFAVAMRMPRADEDQAERRRTALAAAARQAAQVPLATVRRCLEMADLVEALAGRSNVNAASDLVVASLLVDAAARGAAANVRVNLPSVRDASFSEATERELEALLSQVEVATEMTRRVIESGVTREPVTP